MQNLSRSVSIGSLGGRFPSADETFVFGSFRLIPAQRMLLEDGKPLPLGSRALDILLALVESAGETIPKEKLIARTWPDTVVDEGASGSMSRRCVRRSGWPRRQALRRQQPRPRLRLRRAGDAGACASATAAPTNGRGRQFARTIHTIVGRDDVIVALAAQLARRRFLTIVGPGGIGKTTVAVAVAGAVRGSYKDGAWFIGLAPLSDSDLVPGALCALLGITLSGVNPLSGLAAWLRDKHILIVLDG